MTDDITGGLRPQYQTYNRQKCFIAYSEQSPWAVDLLSVCEDVLNRPEYNMEADYARKHFASDVPLWQKALELIANAHYGIYDLSCWRLDDRSLWQMPRNVMIELGIAIALNRPVLLLRHASNQVLPLPKGLQSLNHQILEFSGTTTLTKVLAENLPQWIGTTPDTAWWNRYCTFGGRVCDYREIHPQAKQLGKQELTCTIADGDDPCQPDFRGVVEDVLSRYSDVTHIYLDSLPLQEGYNFLLCSHCQMTRSSPLAMYRVTPHTPMEAFISIGISLALEAQFEYKIPRILMTEQMQSVPSLLTGYEVCSARNDKERRDLLKRSIPEVLRKARQTAWKPRPLPFIEVQSTQPEAVENLESSGNQNDASLSDRLVFIGNLAPETTLEDITGIFSKYGSVRQIDYISVNGSSPRLLGFAIVEMDDAEKTKIAIAELNRSVWRVGRLTVRRAKIDELASKRPLKISENSPELQRFKVNLRDLHDDLTAAWKLGQERLNYLRKALIIEANTANRFQMKEEIRSGQESLSQLENELSSIEQMLEDNAIISSTFQRSIQLNSSTFNSNSKQKMLELQLHNLQEQLDLINYKLKSLSIALISESSPANRFRLDQEIQAERASLHHLKSQINSIEQALNR